MKTTKITLLVLALAVGVFSSCKKKKEAPQAPVSPVKSFTFNTNSAAWIMDYNTKSYNATLTLEEIDSDILASGSASVFVGDGTGSVWTAMPITVKNVQCSSSISMHTVTVNMSASDNVTLANPGVQQFKVVVIKGSARMAHPNANLNNYDELKSTFNLAD